MASFGADGGGRFTGPIQHTGVFKPNISADSLLIRSGQEFALDFTNFRVHDAYNTNLPGAGATDDLGLVGGTFGTASPSLQTEDLKAAAATNNYARFAVVLPPNYVAGQTVKLRFSAGMLTTIADTTATLDLVCHQLDEDTTVQADICATAAQSINSIAFADFDFTITATALSPGDWLDCRIQTAVNDGATGTAVIACVATVKRVCDTQG